jgi:hypothetical protein
MWRSLFSALMIYGFGHPSFDGYRPTLLDRPFQSFYVEVNQFARDGRTALKTLDDARCMRYLKAYIDHMDAQLRGTD